MTYLGHWQTWVLVAVTWIAVSLITALLFGAYTRWRGRGEGGQ